MSDRSHHPGAFILPLHGLTPRIHSETWVAPGAVVAGDAQIGADTSVWYGSVVRADVNSIHIGSRSNLQDHCIVHVTRNRFSTRIGDEVTVGHRAVVHGCEVEDGALIGIGAIVLDGAIIGEEALVGAGAVVTPGTKIPAGTVAVGVPARVVRELDPEERRQQRLRALAYVETARSHAVAMRGREV